MAHPPEYAAPELLQSSQASIAVEEKPEAATADRDRPVVVTGASGFVGSNVCRLLVESGWKVRAVVRDAAGAARRIGHLRLEIRTGDVREVTDMRSALAGAGAVIHLAAIAIEKKGESYMSTNADATRVLLDSAVAENVDKFIHMSQNGADAESPHDFLRSKGLAENAVKTSNLAWSVLRPSVIFGPGDEFVNVLARLVRLSPGLFPLPGGGTARFQPVAVGDVARAVLTLLEDPATLRRTYAIGGAVPLTLRQMSERILIAMNASRLLVGVPVPLLRPAVAIAQRILPNPPVTTSLLDLLDSDNVVENNEIESLGIDPVPFAPEELLYLKEITAAEALRSFFN